MKPRLLDLFCGAGGCAKGYQRAGFYVVGVDVNPQPNYCGDEFVQADALTVLSDWTEGALVGPRWWNIDVGFDAIHASPPCQHYSSITKVTGRAEDHPDLIGSTRELLEAAGLPYVMENVERARPWMRDPAVICAMACGLSIDEEGKRYRLKRHRLFETNWTLMVPPCACHRGGGEVLGVYGGGTRQDTRLRKNLNGGNTNKANRDQARLLMEMPWATRQEMNLAVPPAYTELIGHQLIQHLERKAAA